MDSLLYTVSQWIGYFFTAVLFLVLMFIGIGVLLGFTVEQLQKLPKWLKNILRVVGGLVFLSSFVYLTSLVVVSVFELIT